MYMFLNADYCEYHIFFFSSRRRHTRCALVTGVRRVLFRSGPVHVVIDPIYGSRNARRRMPLYAVSIAVADDATMGGVAFGYVKDLGCGEERSEERRGGKECVSTCRYRWSLYHAKKKKIIT